MTDKTLQPGKMAPHSQEAEEAVLGSILINPQAYFEVGSFLKSEDFFFLKNSWIWNAIHRLQLRGDVIEPLTVSNELRAQEQLEEAGGPAYITYLVNNTPTSVHAEAYGRIVERAAIRRRMLEASGEINQLAFQEDADINEVIDRAESALFNVTERRLRRDIVPIEDALSDYYDRIEHLYNNKGEPVGVPSGFTDLDSILGGFQRSDLIILAARPGVGKTSLMLNMAMNAARNKARVAVFSLEMSKDQLVQRLVATETGINAHRLRLGDLASDEWTLFTEATGALSKLRIYLDDTPAISPLQLRTKCRRLYREFGLDLIVVDYLQLMTGGGSRSENRVQEISYISRSIKELAREINVPLIAGAQLSRSVEQRTDKRPVLSDLRESGSIEQDADVVMFIYRDELYNEATERPNEADVIVSKHRNGPTGTAVLFFRKELTQFANLKKTDIDLGDY